MEIAQLIIEALKFIFPAYCANAIPVIAGGGRPIDSGKKFFDGKPIFGNNKTIRGFFSGLVVGTAVGLAEGALFPEYRTHALLFGLLLSLGALFGDLTGAFIKRRLGIASGGLLPVVDQVDFIIGAILFSFFLFLPFMSPELIITVLVITPPIHVLTNFVAYELRLKDHPW
jgi:CDP-2,3-bis-(O-geranylgeranyl)-sn-glycerol synthase